MKARNWLFGIVTAFAAAAPLTAGNPVIATNDALCAKLAAVIGIATTS